MKCEYCENEISNGVTTCPYCGAVVSTTLQSSLAPDLTNFQNSEQLIQAQRKEYIKREKELLQQQLELEKEKAKLEQLRKNNAESMELSPCSRILFLLLGITLGLFGIQFLYARRFISFAIVLLCAILAAKFSSSSVAILGAVGMIISFFASFIVDTDGKKRKMPWLRL